MFVWWGLCVEQEPSLEPGFRLCAQAVAGVPGKRVTWQVRRSTDCAESYPQPEMGRVPSESPASPAPRNPGKELDLGSAGGKVSGGAGVEPPPLLPPDTSCHQTLVSLRTMLAVTKKKQEKAQSSTKPTQKVWRKGDPCLLTVP